MKRIITITAITTLSAFSFFLLNACSKNKCYDAALAAYYKDKGCYTNCPGIIGCDGKSYCNECEAAKLGIRPMY